VLVLDRRVVVVRREILLGLRDGGSGSRTGPDRAERLTLLLLHLGGIRAPALLELQMLADRVVEQSHARGDYPDGRAP
jgi:hypothetical protein